MKSTLNILSNLFTAIYRIALVGVIGCLALSIFLALPEVSSLAGKVDQADQAGEQAANGFFDGIVNKFKRIVKYDIGRETGKVANNTGKAITEAGKDTEQAVVKAGKDAERTVAKAGKDVEKFVGGLFK